MSAPSTEVLFARCHDECVRLLAENERLKQALNDLAEAAEVAAQGGIHNSRLIDGSGGADG